MSNIVCEKVRQHRERITDLKKNGRKLYGVIYDEAEAIKPIRFIEKNITLYEDEWYGKPFKLSDWQKEDIIMPLFGFRYEKTGFRVFREAYVQLAKKTGKSPLNAAIMLFILFCCGQGQSIYTAGTTAKTARIVFEDCLNFIKSSPYLRDLTIPYGKTQKSIKGIVTKHNNSSLFPLSADTLQDGFRVNAASIDELHLHKDPYLHNVLCASGAAKRESLILKITTAGEDLNSVCYSQYEKTERILNGSMSDNSFFCYVAEADKLDDWMSREAYVKANPNMGVTVDESFLKQKLSDAISMPHRNKQSYFRYHLNRWYVGGAEAWLNFEEWMACKQDYTEEDLHGCPIWLGIDLSKTTDLTAIVGIAEKDGKLYVLPWCYLPQERIDESDGSEAPYRQWVEEGHIIPGDPAGTGIIDYDLLFQKIVEIASNFDLQYIGVDRSGAALLVHQLVKAGFDVDLVNQSPLVFSDPCKEFERHIKENLIFHNNNPCLNWQITNAEIKASNDLIRPMKEYKSSKKRIDALISTIMALYGRNKMKMGQEDDFYGDVWGIDEEKVIATNRNDFYSDVFNL